MPWDSEKFRIVYYEQLISNGSPEVHMQVVDGSKHAMILDRNGYALLRKTVLSLIPKSGLIGNLSFVK